jgi:ABC-2 type transport system permease protein
MMRYLLLMELKLLLRKKITAFSVIGVPVALAAVTLFGNRPDEPAGWGRMLASNVLLLTVLSTYLVTLTVFTARRQSLVLKRLRTSSLSDVAIFAGVLAPVAVVGLGQAVAFLGVAMFVGAPAPVSVVPVVVGVLLCVTVATALGVATACLSRSVEVTQVTGAPVAMAGVAGLFLTQASSETAVAFGLALPLTGPADMVARGWSAGVVVGDVPVVPLDLASAVVWLVVAGVVVSRAFRWEPRS